MLKRRTIAVVDDEAVVRIALERLLRACGMKVATFAGGSEFLAAPESLHPHCLVLDLHMPDMSGFKVLEILMQAGRKLPVVVLTGHDAPEARARALASGASAYLTKPIDDRLLLDAIAAAIAAGQQE
jgi:FixJ family two-component response regulator